MIVPQGPSEKCLCVFSSFFFSSLIKSSFKDDLAFSKKYVPPLHKEDVGNHVAFG